MLLALNGWSPSSQSGAMSGGGCGRMNPVGPMNVVLISTYELGRQPFGLASPAAWLRQDGCSVTCLDFSVQRFEEGVEALAAADLIAFYLPMHTATRLAAGLLERIRGLNARTHLCCYGLYAPVNEDYLRSLGAGTILGGEFEAGLVSLVRRLSAPTPTTELQSNRTQSEPRVSLDKQKFLVPDRCDLPTLDQYARLHMAPGDMRIVGYTEASRGCKHLCRHCPVVPVYQGSFRIVQRDVVLEDIRRQVAAGAQHITFGDPDFFNGPTHGVAIVKAMHAEFPELTYDVTIKVEHLLKQRKHLPTLRDTGCVFVTCAVESVDNRIVEILEKHHTREDFIEAVHLFRVARLHMNPTFVTFTPWTSIKGYVELLQLLHELDLVDNVAPIQYAIRLLIPDSSRLLELAEVQELVGEFDHEKLYYPWVHPDPRVDQLHRDVLKAVQQGQDRQESRRQIFQRVWDIAHQANEGIDYPEFRLAPQEPLPALVTIPYLTEPWYC